MLVALVLIGGIMIVLGLVNLLDGKNSKGFSLSILLTGAALMIPSAIGDTRLNVRQNEAFKLAKAGFINPIPTDSGDFGVTVPGVDGRVKILSHDGAFYVVDFSGAERKVTEPADVRELIGK
jgi:hypothetical protein